MEGTHRELRPRLTDRLRRDHSDRLATLDRLAGGQRGAVGGTTDAELGLVGQWREHPDLVDLGIVAQRLHLGDADLGALGELGAIGKGQVLGEGPAEQPGLEVVALARLIGTDVLEHEATDRTGLIERVALVDDELLGDIDQTPRQIARVSSTQRRVDESLTGARGGDEVLEDRQALTEVGLDRTGNHVATWVRHESTHARDLTDLRHRPTSTRADHHVDRVELLGRHRLLHGLGDLAGGGRPDLDLLLLALAVGDDAPAELLLHLVGLVLVTVEDVVLVRRRTHVVDRHRETRAHGPVEAETLEGIERCCGLRLGELHREVVHQVGHLPLAHGLVDIRVALGQALVEQDPPSGRGVVLRRAAVGRGLHQFGVLRPPVGDLGVDVESTGLHRALDLVDAAQGHALTLGALHLGGDVEGTDDHVLGGSDQRLAVCRAQHVVAREHQHTRLGLGLGRQREVYRHLVAVEVGVERRADQRVDLDRLALDQHGLEGLDAETVQRRSTVEEHRVLLDDVLEHVPDLRTTTLHHALGRLDVLGQGALHERLHHEGLEQLQRHQLGKTALVQLQGRADHDDRTARVVDALAEQVLTETALLALQHVREALERAVAGTGDRASAAAIVEQCVDGLLEHPLLVVDDDLGCTEIEQTLQAVVAVDHPAVQVVEIRGGEAATVELHHRTQVRRNHRHDVEDHGPGVVDPVAGFVAAVERGDDLEALGGLLLALGRERLLALLGIDGGAELDLFLIEIDAVDEQLDGIGAHATLEVLLVAVAQLAPQHLVLDDLTLVHGAELVPGALEEFELGVELLTDRFEVLVSFLAKLLEIGFLLALGLGGLELGLELLHAAREFELALLLDRIALAQHVGLEALEVLVAPIDVDPGDEIGREVDDLLELLRLQLLLGLDAREEVGQPGTGATQVPDVHRGGGELDVAHAVTTNLRARDLHTTSFTDDALEAHPLVLAAVALPVLGRTEDLLAEQAVLLRLERAVVDRLGLAYLAVRPGADGVRRGQTDVDLIEHIDVA